MTEKSDGLRKTLTPLDAVMIVVGNVVGVGIFTTTGFMASDLPDARWIMLAWIFGGFLTLLGALTYGELGAMFPRAGGDYVYVREAYGPWAGFLVGWVGFLIINPASIAALALGFVEYLLPVAVRNPEALPPLAPKLIAASSILVLTLLNYISVKWASRAQNLVSSLNLFAIFLVAAAGLFWGAGSWGHFEYRSEAASISGVFGPPMVSVFFTYMGWFVSAYVASEMKDPQKTLPFSLIVSSMIVTLVYVMINIFYIYALPIPEMKGVVDIGRRASEALLGSGVSVLVSIMIMLAVLGSLNSVILTAPRIYFAMARDGVFPRAFGTVHPEHRTPHYSIAVQAVISCALVFVGAFYQLLSYSVFFMLLTSVAAAAAVFVIRRRNPELERPYKVWGYPYTTLIFVVSYVWIAIRIFLYNPLNAIIGICITLTGVPFYLYWSRKRAVEA